VTDRAEQHLTAFPGIVELIGGSTAAEIASASFQRAAGDGSPVLIVAEPGLDGAAVARAIHDRSARCAGPFLAVECAAGGTALLGEQIFGTRAQGGTLMLANLQELPTPLQARLARVLRDGQIAADGVSTARTFDARVMASLSGSLDEAVQEGTLRRDVIARFAHRIDLPPLRQRPADIPALIGCLVGESAMAAHLPLPTFTREALTLLAALPWRRNFEELREVLDLLVRAAVGGVVGLEEVLDHIPVERTASGHGHASSLREARLSFERQYIAKVLNRHRGRMEEAARSLGIQRTNLYRKARQLGIGLQRANQKCRLRD
jgi:two-component system response regulator AtoC